MTSSNMSIETQTQKLSQISLENSGKNSEKNFDKFLCEIDGIIYKTYPGEHLISEIMELMQEELSEPYPIFTYRYFLNDYPDSCIMAYQADNL